MRWACILLTQLALDGVQRGCEDPHRPLVLLAGLTSRRIIRALNPEARQLGLKPGMSLIAAQSLANGFAQADYDEQQIQHWHHFLAAWAYRFSSHVSLDYPRALLLEVESSMGLFGPWPRFEQRLRQELNELGFQHRIVIAPNAAAARALANVHDGLAVTDALALRRQIEKVESAALESAGNPRRHVSKIKDNYDYIIIDCPPTLGRNLLGALALSTHVITVVKVSGFAVDGASGLMRTIGFVQSEVNRELVNAGLLVNMFDNSPTHWKSYKNLVEHLGSMIFDNRLRYRTPIDTATSEGIPVKQLQYAHVAAKELEDVLEEIFRRTA